MTLKRVENSNGPPSQSATVTNYSDVALRTTQPLPQINYVNLDGKEKSSLVLH